jgi:hypothetical protein
MKARSDEQMRSFLQENSIPITECGCRIWLNGTDKDGYGQTWFQGRNIRAHRLSYLLNKGPLHPDQVVMHSCDIPSCINPEHLSPGTSIENTSDRHRKGRTNVAHGDAHYMRRSRFVRAGEKCPTVKLVESDVLQIRELFAQGHNQSQLAQRFSVSRTCISAIVTRRNWSHI